MAEPLHKALDPKTAKVLADGLDLETVGDLLRHYPRRYAERGQLTDLARIELDEHVTVVARVAQVTKRTMRARRGTIVEAVVTDGTAKLSLTFFNQAWRERDLAVGRRGLFSGKVGAYRGSRQLINPDYQLLPDDEVLGAHFDGVSGAVPEGEAESPVQTLIDRRAVLAGGLVAIYPATAKLPSWKVAQCIGAVLDTLPVEEVDDPLPDDVLAQEGMLGLHAALNAVHRPTSAAEKDRAVERLRFEEAFVMQVALARRRARTDALPAVPRPGVPDGLLAAFDARLPFTLTPGQQEVGSEVMADLARPHPMHRLLQGEVGSGKTVVALRAMLTVVDSGGQAALLAPTEVLAQQHHRSLTALLGDLAQGGRLGGAENATRVALLTGSASTASRREAMLEAASGQAGIVVGTHALLQARVDFADLGLVVVDEQHRFGVEQRDALRAKASQPPHVLVMTATPIPRTVAMTVFGDLAVSTLRELPGGRRPITTHVVPGDNPAWMARTWQRIREEAEAGRQTFVVCPRIGDDEPEGSAPSSSGTPDQDREPPLEDERRPPVGAVETLERLRDNPDLAGLRIELLHGRLTPDVKDAVMADFVTGRIDVLVATTVVEVGVDVPSAGAMVVMDADRFGVSQLHQLRGRVGRGGLPGLCLLVTDIGGGPTRERLDAVAATLDGFELSRVDLEARREGDVLGVAQSGGRSSLRLLQVVRDEEVIVAARRVAIDVVAADPDLTAHPALAAVLAEELAAEREAFLERG